MYIYLRQCHQSISFYVFCIQNTNFQNDINMLHNLIYLLNPIQKAFFGGALLIATITYHLQHRPFDPRWNQIEKHREDTLTMLKRLGCRRMVVGHTPHNQIVDVWHGMIIGMDEDGSLIAFRNYQCENANKTIYMIEE